MRKRTSIWSFIKSILLALILVFVINTWLFKPVHVVGNSMHPTLKDGQQGFSSVISLNTQGVNRFDIVVVQTGTDFLVKRVIGLPNEKLEFRNDYLYINDEIINQDFLDTNYIRSFSDPNKLFTDNFGPILLQEDEYFLMGDNRQVSIDSRYSQYGPFHKDDIVSKYMMVLYPFNEVEWVGENK